MDTEIPLQDQLSELRREARVRRSVYPRWVANGRMTAEEAARQQERLAAAIATLERLYLTENQMNLPL